MVMFDEWDRLVDCPQLLRLLAHYGGASDGDRLAWQDRLQSMEGVKPRALVALHGELLAQDWIEQNTGTIEVLIPGAVPRCYRVTSAGLRALRAAASASQPEEGENQAA